jgi:ubiquinone/menaquinone biosynthesis C-methylase UbiE
VQGDLADIEMGEIFKQERPSRPLEFTGERYTNAITGQIEIEHLHRYLLARDCCRGKTVLDIACGEGYGAALLAQVAECVIGVDFDAATITHAQKEYSRTNLGYIVGDARKIPLSTDSVDVVTSFETLEHFAEQEEFLEEVRRVLRPDGLLLISTPDCELYSPAGANPYHLRELTREEFTSILSRYFSFISVSAQRLLVGSAIFPRDSDTQVATAVTYERRDDRHLERSDGLPRAIYLVARASDRPSEDALGPSLYIHKTDVSETENALNSLHAQLTAAHAEAAIANARAEASLAELRDRNASLEHATAAQRSVAEKLERDKAALEQVVTDLRDESGRLLGSAEQCAQRLRDIEQSTTWQATAVLRAAAGGLPRPVRRNLRRAARAAYWVLTPHRLPARIRFLWERHQASHSRSAVAALPGAPVERTSYSDLSPGAPPLESWMTSIGLSWPVRRPKLQVFPSDWLVRGPVATEDADFTYSIDEFIAFRDILFLSGAADHKQKQIIAAFVVFHGAVQRISMSANDGQPLRFDLRLTVPADQPDSHIQVGFEFADGSRFLIEVPYRQSWAEAPTHQVFQTFQAMVRKIDRGQILEIGSRARSGTLYREFIPAGMSYVGLDILEGPNVDVVGDAHELSRHFAPETFDAAYSIAVFEHLLMPWKAAIELNKVLKPGGVAFIASHQTFNLHEVPWDFWRFSDKAWHALFNKFTGFEILEAQMGERAYIVGGFLNPMTWLMDRAPAFMASTVICRKIGPCAEQWHADLPSLVDSVYPQ